MKTTVLLFAAIYGGLGILFGAFGAHALKKILPMNLLQSFETGVKYQMYHAIVLLGLGSYFDFESILENVAAWTFIIGTFLFSFSIYALCLAAINKINLKAIGPVTPLGGLLLFIGWCSLAVFFTR